MLKSIIHKTGMKTLTQFYKKNLPDKDDFVLGKIKKITDLGIDVDLLEYENLTAYLSFKDASNKKRIHHIRKLFKVNKELVFNVVSVVQDKKFVDLSKKNQTEEEENEFLIYYKNYKLCLTIINKFFRYLCVDTIEEQRNLMNKYFWEIDPKNLHSVFMSIKKNNNYHEILDNQLSIEEKNKLKELINENFIDSKYTVRIPFRINTFSVEGISLIKNCLTEIEKETNTITYIKSSPIYYIEFKDLLEENLNSYIEQILSKLNNIEFDKSIMISFLEVEKIMQ